MDTRLALVFSRGYNELGTLSAPSRDCALPFQPAARSSAQEDHMASRIGLAAVLVFALALPYTSVFAQGAEKKSAELGHPVAIKAAALAYGDINVPGFAPGLKIAVLHGDPSQSALYTLRLQFPDGYVFPPHWHPMDEHVTVVSGTFYLGMGEKANKEAALAYQPGDYLVAPARMAHFGWVKGETVVQLHGMGPFEINIVGQK
jgi:quercetin dioxygenase-like cupin family protein